MGSGSGNGIFGFACGTGNRIGDIGIAQCGCGRPRVRTISACSQLNAAAEAYCRRRWVNGHSRCRIYANHCGHLSLTRVVIHYAAGVSVVGIIVSILVNRGYSDSKICVVPGIGGRSRQAGIIASPGRQCRPGV